MQEVIKCPQCDSKLITESILCSYCGATIYGNLLDHEMMDFMTTGTDPRLPPRSDSA